MAGRHHTVVGQRALSVELQMAEQNIVPFFGCGYWSSQQPDYFNVVAVQ
jgi:hypothetical protein